MFSDQLRALETSTSELETLHMQRLESSQRDAAESSAKIKDMEILNDTLSKGLQKSIEERFLADDSAKQVTSISFLPMCISETIVVYAC